jgi:hypothetical protein
MTSYEKKIVYIVVAGCFTYILPARRASLQVGKYDTCDVVYASIEDSADTKTYLEDNKVLWGWDDEILAFIGKNLRKNMLYRQNLSALQRVLLLKTQIMTTLVPVILFLIMWPFILLQS